MICCMYLAQNWNNTSTFTAANVNVKYKKKKKEDWHSAVFIYYNLTAKALLWHASWGSPVCRGMWRKRCNAEKPDNKGCLFPALNWRGNVRIPLKKQNFNKGTRAFTHAALVHSVKFPFTNKSHGSAERSKIQGSFQFVILTSPWCLQHFKGPIF